jgi:hypothetical protein
MPSWQIDQLNVMVSTARTSNNATTTHFSTMRKANALDFVRKMLSFI